MYFMKYKSAYVKAITLIWRMFCVKKEHLLYIYKQNMKLYNIFRQVTYVWYRLVSGIRPRIGSPFRVVSLFASWAMFENLLGG